MIRREDTEVTIDSLKKIVRRASDKLQEDGFGPVDSSDCKDVETISRFQYSCLLGKVNTDMHGNGAGISNKNGYELHRSIFNSVDAIPANAEFTHDQALMQLVPMYAGKLENLKDLYEFRVDRRKC